MARKRKASFLARHYEKLLVALSLVVLAASLAVSSSGGASVAEDANAFLRKVKSLKPANPVYAETPDAAFRAALAAAEEPWVLGTNGTLLVAAERVACIKCGQPIPMKDDRCRHCGADQPSETMSDDWDTDGDGLPDVWEKANGLNPLDALDAHGDEDGDGFTNAEEFQAKTDPRLPASHPPRFAFFRVSEVEATPFPYLLRGSTKLPDGSFKFQVNDTRTRQTYSLRKGEKLPKEDFELTAAETRRKVVKRPGMPDKERDVWFVTFTRGEDSVELEENGPAVSSAFEVTIVCTKDKSGAGHHVKRLESFTFDGESFTLLSVNPKARAAILRRDSTKEELRVPAAD